MTSQQEADRALAEHWAERERKEREQRQQKRRVIVVRAILKEARTPPAASVEVEELKDFIQSASFSSRSADDGDTIFCQIYTPGYPPQHKGSFGFYVKDLRAILLLLTRGPDQGEVVQTSIATKQESCPESATRTETAAAIYSALSEAYVEHSALSVSGFNLFGDSKSIKAAQKWLHSHNQIDDLKTNLRHWRDECGKLHAQLTKTPSADHDDGNLRDKLDIAISALEFARDGYDRTDIKHIEYRVGVYTTACDALDKIALPSIPNHQPHAVSQGWQDIETAPRDGSDFLASTAYGVRLVFWDTARGGVWSVWPGRDKALHPTYWMPLPAPPSPAKTGGDRG